MHLVVAIEFDTIILDINLKEIFPRTILLTLQNPLGFPQTI